MAYLKDKYFLFLLKFEILKKKEVLLYLLLDDLNDYRLIELFLPNFLLSFNSNKNYCKIDEKINQINYFLVNYFSIN